LQTILVSSGGISGFPQRFKNIYGNMLTSLPSPVVKGPEREAYHIALSRVLWLRVTGSIHPRPICPSCLAQGQLSFTFNYSTHYPQCQGVMICSLTFQHSDVVFCYAQFIYFNSHHIIKVLLPTDAQENCFKTCIKIYTKTAPTCFGVITIIRERTTWAC
jgi:hypothetical protein